jgi:hypothetical protein
MFQNIFLIFSQSSKYIVYSSQPSFLNSFTCFFFFLLCFGLLVFNYLYHVSCWHIFIHNFRNQLTEQSINKTFKPKIITWHYIPCLFFDLQFQNSYYSFHLIVSWKIICRNYQNSSKYSKIINLHLIVMLDHNKSI